MQKSTLVIFQFVACLALAFSLVADAETPTNDAAKKELKASEKVEAKKEKIESKDDQKKVEDELVEILAGHSFHGSEFNEGPRQGARLIEGTGDVHFPVTSKIPEVQKFIDQGVGQLHGFWFFEAERSFRQAAMLDPECALAYWGMARANINNDKRAKKFIAKAHELKEKASEAERMWIKALYDFHHKKQKDGKAKWQAYITDIEDIVHKYPKNIEAKAHLALHLFWGDSGKALGVPSREAVDGLLSQVFEVNPMHPVHHYRIHLWDRKKPERSLHSAAHIGQSSPGIAHMWHMSGHIFSRLKRYEDACWQQEASSRVDHAYMVKDRVLPTEIHNYTHNQEWFIRNLIKVGRIRDAIKVAKNLVELPRHPRHNSPSKKDSAVVRGRTRLLDVLIAFELWDELIDLSDSPYLAVDDSKDDLIRKLRYLGVAYAASSNETKTKEYLVSLEKMKTAELEKEKKAELKKEEKQDLKKDVKKKAKNDVVKKKGDVKKEEPKVSSKKPAVEKSESKKAAVVKEEKKSKKPAPKRKKNKQLESIKKAIAHIEGQKLLTAGKPKEALELFEKASDVAKTTLAKVQLAAGNQKEALKLAKQEVVSKKNESYPLAVYAQILHASGNKKESKKTFEKLRESSTSIYADMSIFAEMKPIAVDLGFTENWLKEPIQKEDVGKRPPLASLGPLLWHTSEAPAWSLPSEEDKTVSLENFSGKPVVVIFYLGFGCLHCVEQLETFSPLAEKYREAGIEIVAIGSDDNTTMKKSIETYQEEKELNIPLLSDSEMKVFNQYRCYDDFEKQALHGTFLIDGQGQIKWSDVSYEPFTDAKFLLKESQRLLSLPANRK